MTTVISVRFRSGSKTYYFDPGQLEIQTGDDVVVEVPCGTVVFDAETGEYLAEVTEHNQELKLLRGGRGGLCNWHFLGNFWYFDSYLYCGFPGRFFENNFYFCLHGRCCMWRPRLSNF